MAASVMPTAHGPVFCPKQVHLPNNALCLPKASDLRRANRDAPGVQRAIY